jgi:hypothetical protein
LVFGFIGKGDDLMDGMDGWILIILLIEGLPLLGFVYYLEYKRRIYLLEKEGPGKEPRTSPLERKMVKGLFLVISGFFLIFAPAIASIIGMEAEISYEILLIGALIISAGLAIIISSGILKIKGLADANDGFEIK